MKTKNVFFSMLMLPFVIATTSCTSTKNIGTLNMVATRNIETTTKYVVLQKYTELTNKEKKKSRAETIQEAIDAIVKKVDGGEYLMNAKIYLVKHDYIFAYSYYYAVGGDVWGKK